MKLSELIRNVDVIDGSEGKDPEISSIAYHTKDVVHGSCFVAISGNAADGHEYVNIAIEQGAVAVVLGRRAALPENIADVVVDNPRKALAIMSARWFKDPSRELKLIGITGTNGKTTITYLLESIWKVCGFQAGVVGTVNYRYADVSTNPEHTTPGAYELQKLFRDMCSAHVTHVAMEVSSHSLDQDRVYGCNFDGAVFTNLTQDHLDYHLDMARYGEAKEKLFTRHLIDSIKSDKWSVVNVDDQFGAKLASKLTCRVITFSLKSEVDVYVESAKYSLSDISLSIRIGEESLEIDSSLVGRHNASNILSAVAAAYAMGIEPKKIKKGIESLKGVPGRLHPVKNSKGLNVLVDYAHTPDAIRNVTTAIKALKPKRLITVFGCGGDRDKTKRPLMGFEAALKSDVLIVTSDNPRSEDPSKIIEEIMTGIKKVGLEKDNGYFVEADRRKAIAIAIKMATPEDVVLIAGKGHEDYQIIGKEKLAFDDYKVASETIEAM